CTCVLNAPPPSAIYTLSLHDALPISPRGGGCPGGRGRVGGVAEDSRRPRAAGPYPSRWPRRRAGVSVAGRPARAISVRGGAVDEDRKSTRLNSSHDQISYAVFCLKKK